MCKDPRSVKPFEALEEKEGDGGTAEGKDEQKKLPEELRVPMEGLEENEVDDMELRKLDLDAIEA